MTQTSSLPARPRSVRRLLVPLIFDPYATDLVRRVSSLRPRSVLEVAAGTGVVTQAMAAGLDPDTRIVGSDLNRPMIDHAIKIAPRGRSNGGRLMS